MSVTTRKRFAVYDPATDLFVGRLNGKSVWIDNLDLIQTYSHPKQALDLLTWARTGSSINVARPNCEMVEMEIVTSYTITPFSYVRSETPEYQRAKAVYDQLLPQATEDPDAMSIRDWKRWKTARAFLRKIGEVA